MNHMRADMRLVQSGLFPDAERATRAILAGDVAFDTESHERVQKPGQPVAIDARFLVTQTKDYVSRGGKKLKGALDDFGYDISHKRVIDVGCSTGGFTDCALQEGARSVCALDVGYGQLAWKLRIDDRVDVRERENIRTVDLEEIGAPFDVAVADLSFISLDRVLDPLRRAIGDDGEMIVLVKPQFEAEKCEIGDKGVVHDADTHIRVLTDAAREFLRCDMDVVDVTYSPITGPQGNIEFWIWGKGRAPGGVHAGGVNERHIEDIVIAAHERLG